MKKVVFIPAAILLVILIAFATTGAYRVPTFEASYVDDTDRPANVATVEYEVDGLKCRGMAGTFSEQIKDVPGVLSFVSYARTRSAIVEYDPALTNPDEIREAFEASIVIEGETYDDVFRMVSRKDL